MTSYVFRALVLSQQYDPVADDYVAVDAVTMDASISLRGNASLLPYQLLGASPDGDLEVDIGGFPTGTLIVGGQVFEGVEPIENMLQGITWTAANGPQNTTLAVVTHEPGGPGTSEAIIFAVGGTALPEIASVAEFQAFFAGVTYFGAPLHTVGPGSTIDLSAIPGVTAQQDDYFRVENDPFETFALPGGQGSDTIDFTDVLDTYTVLDYAGLAGPITVTIDAENETGSVVKAGVGTDSFIALGDGLEAGWNTTTGGLSFVGTNAGDTFTASLYEEWVEFVGGGGNDIYNLDLTDPGIVRLSFDRYNGQNATSGISVNLLTGSVADDGFGGEDQINAIAGSGRLEINATALTDTIIGSDARERFILLGGNDTLNGGGGNDLVRYDRSGISAVSVDLEAGVATGSHQGTAFSHTLLNVESIRGSRNGQDTLTGSAADNQINAYGGNDLLTGGAGNDTIYGGAGADTVFINALTTDVSVSMRTDGYLITSADGIDLIGFDVESFQFNDTLLSQASIQSLTAASDDLIVLENDLVDGVVYFGNGGSDTIDFGDIYDGYVELSYNQITGPISVEIDASTNYGSIIKSGLGTDTLLDVGNAMSSGFGGFFGGFYVIGTGQNDTFDITINVSFIGLMGGAGNDTFNLDLTSIGTVRLDFRANGSGVATQGMVVDLTMGIVSNDGFGGTDVINVQNQISGRLEIQGTANSDAMTGSAHDDRFITLGGNDTVDGGAGVDALRYDRSGIDAVEVNLAGGLATGSYFGASFTQVISNIELVRGNEGNDTLTGNSADNGLDGRGGSDQLYGGQGNDTLLGMEGDDALYGGAGNDLLEGGAGFDLLEGGAGNDSLYGGDANDAMSGGFLQDVLYGGGGADSLSGDAGLDTLFGGAGNDTLYGNDDQDTLYGGDGADVLDGGNGSDVYFVDQFDSVNDSGATGYDRVQINNAAGVTLNNLSLWTGVERINGFTGNDVFDASGAPSALFLFGNEGNDNLSGGDGADTVLGGNGNDTLDGGFGNDILQGGAGNDVFFGGAGDDLIYVGEAGDVVEDGGSGFDRVLINNAAGLSINVGAWQGVERIVGFTGNDFIDATGATEGMTFALGAGNDTLMGGAGRDTVYAGVGNDSVEGAEGDDALIGGTGDDVLTGGAGNDFLLGGTGADVFVFADGFGVDVIRDFADGTDVIDVSMHTGISGMSDLVFQQSGSNTVITLADSGPDQITVMNVTAAALTVEDFIFA
jgi:Ca2+-binding RTX toxin-like protein